MLLRDTGLTWPLLTSMEEPQSDRPISRALLWTTGVHTGEREIWQVKTYLEANGEKWRNCQIKYWLLQHIAEHWPPSRTLNSSIDADNDLRDNVPNPFVHTCTFLVW